MERAGRQVGHEIVVKGAVEIGMALLDGTACSDGRRATHCYSITGMLRRWRSKSGEGVSQIAETRRWSRISTRCWSFQGVTMIAI